LIKDHVALTTTWVHSMPNSTLNYRTGER